MRWLKFAQQYINTGIKPSAGYRVETTVRMGFGSSTFCLFGSRTSTTPNSGSFNAFYIYSSNYPAPDDSYFRLDYAKTGAKKFNTVNVMGSFYRYYDVVLGSTSSVNGEAEAGGSFGSNNYPIYIGTINTAGALDNRYAQCAFSEFRIFNASDVLVFDGVPVAKNSTEFKATPAPSNCYYDRVTDNYFVNSGSNFIDYEDDDLKKAPRVELSKKDYGIKMLSGEANAYEVMNGKYKLFGADLASNKSEFRTYDFTLTGYDGDPVVSWPGYVEDWNFYQGSGVRKKEQLVIDTGFDFNSLKAVTIVLTSSFTNSNVKARAHQYMTSSSGNYNTYIDPSTVNIPYLEGSYTTNTILLDKDNRDYSIYFGANVYAKWNTLGGFNGGTLEEYFNDQPSIDFKLDSAGKLRIYGAVPYSWVQRAGPSYRLRWFDWCWYQGFSFQVTILNSPYIM